MDKLISLGVRGIGNDHMKIGGVKYFTDGSIQGFTGALLEDYYTRPGYKGALLWSQEEIDEIIIKYHCLGFQVAVHTNGDAASESVIQAFEKAVERCPRTDLRHMLIHAQLVSDSQLERMKACGITPEPVRPAHRSLGEIGTPPFSLAPSAPRAWTPPVPASVWVCPSRCMWIRPSFR